MDKHNLIGFGQYHIGNLENQVNIMRLLKDTKILNCRKEFAAETPFLLSFLMQFSRKLKKEWEEGGGKYLNDLR